MGEATSLTNRHSRRCSSRGSCSWSSRPWGSEPRSRSSSHSRSVCRRRPPSDCTWPSLGCNLAKVWDWSLSTVPRSSPWEGVPARTGCPSLLSFPSTVAPSSCQVLPQPPSLFTYLHNDSITFLRFRECPKAEHLMEHQLRFVCINPPSQLESEKGMTRI